MLRGRQRVLLYTPLALVAIPFLVWPALFGLFASFTNYAPLQTHLRLVGLRNYTEVLRDSLFRIGTRNILLMTLVTVPLELAWGLAIAYALRRPFRGRGLIRIALLVPWLVSPIANGVMWHFLLTSQQGMLNFVLGWLRLPPQVSPLGIPQLALLTTMAIEIWRKTPLVSFLLVPGVLAIPADQWDQATLDGAHLWSRVRHIALPWLRPLLLTIALLLIGDTLGTFDSILILTGGGPGTATVTPELYSYQQAFQVQNWTVGATAAWLIAAAVLLIGLGYLRLMRGEGDI
jgi:multiple sugar transport system permease protein